MMIGAVPTSIPEIILLGNWIIELRFRQKWQRLKNNRVFWAIAAVFIIHVLGLTYTSDFERAVEDLKIKAPLLILPLAFFSAAPLSFREMRFALTCFLIGSLANTAWCLSYSFLIHHNEVGRDASRFMSHIRLGLYLNMAVACSVYFISTIKNSAGRFLMVLLMLYFITVMFVLGLASALVNLLILAVIWVGLIVYRQRPLIKLTALLLLAVAGVFAVNYVSGISRSQLKVNDTVNNSMARKSISGRPYSHFDNKGQKENGNYVLINIQLDELKQEWQRQFPADSFNFPPHPHNLNRYEVLIRYLASKGLNKDSVGISKLSATDKDNIRKDICNHRYEEWNFLHRRVYELVCEYDDFINRRDVNGHSLTMRLYFWDAAFRVIGQHPLFGVGTGDVQAELNKVYEAHSPLQQEWYKRPHNQFLTVTVALGSVGLFIFLVGVFYPFMKLRRFLPGLYWPFIVLALVSFMPEDTLETQAGVAFYAFFNTIFLAEAFYKKEKSRIAG